MQPSRASANVLPTTGWPAIGISVPGVKIRMRTSVSGRSRAGHERRLGKTDLAGDLLHGLAGKAGRIGKDGELVAAEAAIGEDVVVEVPIPGNAHARMFILSFTVHGLPFTCLR